MGSPAELSLDYKANNNYIELPSDHQSDKIQDYLTRLEQERLKVEAFKRELPLCMQLLDNAMETFRQQLGSRPELEEFIPIKNTAPEKSLNAPPAEKASWMVSAQLWSQANEAANNNQQQLIAPAAVKEEAMVVPKLARNGGAFLPFSKDKNKTSSASTVVAATRGLLELALASSEQKSCSADEKSVESHGGNGSKSVGEAQAKGMSNSVDGPATPQTNRKARRCWSPDLHRRFVNALQILGGSHVATPKQIRELMKVDGLTNDEVKSHLQKYRLHTRRPIPMPQPPTGPQLVVLGGIWVPPEYATSAATSPAIYGAHPGPPHYCAATPIPPEFYTTPVHHHLVAKPTAVHRSASRSSESEVRTDGERSESIEETEGDEREEEDEENVDDEIGDVKVA